MIKALANLCKKRFVCPVCAYSGPFETVTPLTGRRLHARCPSCGVLERHRLQILALDEALREKNTAHMVCLHMAPEKTFETILRKTFGHYITADISGEGVDFKVDLTRIPFPDAMFDMVYASHVLEHIHNDILAMTEICRVLKPGGVAILPVPVIGPVTIEYGAANLVEEGHVRCPGKDYFDRMRKVFSQVRVYNSDEFPAKYQLYCYEERSSWPTGMPLRPKVMGKKHVDYVPVCVKR